MKRPSSRLWTAAADDYITKPFATNELLARIRSVIRRVPEHTEGAVEIGDFIVDVTSHSTSVRDVRCG